MCKSCDPNKLYTCIVQDLDVGYFHNLVVNAPGCNSALGIQAFDYFFSFAVDVNAGAVNPNPADDFNHRHVHACFEQTEELDTTATPLPYPTASGCDGILTTRSSTTVQSLIDDLNLSSDPVCANVIRVPYTAASNNGVCQLSRCNPTPPLTLAGITDQPECAQGATGDFPTLP